MKFREKRNRDYPTDTVALDELYVPERTVERILRKDWAQIEKMRGDFECGRPYVRVVVRPCEGGGYIVEDGRHRVIAARLAGETFIDAIVVGE